VSQAIAGREIQAALVGVMVLALVAVLAVRFTSSAPSAAVAGASSSPRASAAGASSRPAATFPTASAIASPLAAAGTAGPSAGVAAAATPAAATPRPTARPSSTPAAARTYKVKSGDTLYAIAKRFNTTVARLMELNNITDPRALRVGQILKLP
jgi:LysM repeat protein